MTALALTGVVRRYGHVTALDGVDLAVAAGEVLALLGPNGAGKSTLVRLACGLEAPDAGTVAVHGEDPARRLRTRRRVGVAPQEIGIYPQLTVRQNLWAFGEVAGLRRREARRRAEELLPPFGLGPLGDRPAGRLSGGEQRRLHAAAALVHRPSVVLLDEPTAGADPATRGGVLEAVLALAAEGTAVLYTTHYLPEVERLDAAVAILERGRLVATGGVAELVAGHGAASLLLAFAGGAPAPLLERHPDAVVREDGSVAVPTPDPAETLRDLLGRLDVAPTQVAMVQPSLEAAYLTLTGRTSAGPAPAEALA